MGSLTSTWPLAEASVRFLTNFEIEQILALICSDVYISHPYTPSAGEKDLSFSGSFQIFSGWNLEAPENILWQQKTHLGALLAVGNSALLDGSLQFIHEKFFHAHMITTFEKA